jgi:hypothetical protein
LFLGGKFFGFAAFAALAVHVVTLLDFHPAQDECSFGPVSNQRYRELLAQAERMQRRQWPLIIWKDDVLQRLLNEQFQTMTNDTTTTYEKIATMHAIYRGIGADFLFTTPNNAFSNVADSGGVVGFEYQINVNRLALFYPLGRTGWLIGLLEGHSRSSAQTNYDKEHPPGQLHLIAHYPNPFDPIPDVLHRGQRSCPSVPNAALEPFFRPDAK